MSKTLVEKVASPSPDVSIFKISGTLGYHENEVIEKFFRECEKKTITKLVMDFSNLSSLGGGVAKIIGQAAVNGPVIVCVTGASTRVKTVLAKHGGDAIYFETDVAKGVERMASVESAPAGAAPRPEAAAESATEDAHTATAVETPEPPPEPVQDQAPEEPATVDEPTPAAGEKGTGEPLRSAEELNRKLVQYRSLFSLNSDFNRLQDKYGILDVFLLTVMAQVGVESAAFLEFDGTQFRPSNMKGFEAGDAGTLVVSPTEINPESLLKATAVMPVDTAPISEDAKERLSGLNVRYVAPFVVHENVRGIVVLGKPLRKDFDQDTVDFLSILVNQAAIAYESCQRVEEESERTLGLVQALISMIEENTVSRGNTELIVNYVYALAHHLHYPEEHVRDLMYGTVLRDIGMIKVSDLIVRSPRELMKEEWEIIKRHPIEGAEMLKKMRFSDHTKNIVLCHHERFNGEGYPNRKQGTQIPLGARIVSVVESFAAMLQDRPTRPSLTREEALNTLRENWGNRYDPDVVASFIEIVEEEIRTGELVRYRGSELFKL